MIVNRLNCCGVRELAAINGASNERRMEILYNSIPASKVRARVRRGHCALMLFTQAGASENPRTGYGVSFAKFIREQEMGTVTRSYGGINPNTGRHITMFMWKPNWDKIIAYCQAKGFRTYEPYRN